MTLCVVNNFQSITTELVRQRESQESSEELARMKEELNMELTKHDARMQRARSCRVCVCEGGGRGGELLCKNAESRI